jgi:hypothetical protein
MDRWINAAQDPLHTIFIFSLKQIESILLALGCYTLSRLDSDEKVYAPDPVAWWRPLWDGQGTYRGMSFVVQYLNLGIIPHSPLIPLSVRITE